VSHIKTTVLGNEEVARRVYLMLRLLNLCYHTLGSREWKSSPPDGCLRSKVTCSLLKTVLRRPVWDSMMTVSRRSRVQLMDSERNVCLVDPRLADQSWLDDANHQCTLFEIY
jgi:hypothetical protein